MTNGFIARCLLASYILSFISGMIESDLPGFSAGLFVIGALLNIVSSGFAIKRLW